MLDFLNSWLDELPDQSKQVVYLDPVQVSAFRVGDQLFVESINFETGELTLVITSPAPMAGGQT